jgi:hypothetical protein
VQHCLVGSEMCIRDRNETFAAAHGQNKDFAEPFRSASAMKLIPLISTESDNFFIESI